MRGRNVLSVVVLSGLMLTGLSACSSAADVANNNLANDADNFNIYRHVKVYNERLGVVVLEVEGFCSLNLDDATKYSVLCKVGKNAKGEDVMVKHLASKSANTFIFGEQTVPSGVNTDRYAVNFKPSTVLPDVKVR